MSGYALQLLAVIALVIGGLIWAVLSKRRGDEQASMEAEAARLGREVGEALARQEEIDEFEDRQVMVGRLIGGAELPLYEVTLDDWSLRRIQIIGESMHLVRQTKNDKTRSSRLGVIQSFIEELEAEGWEGFTPASRELVLDAVKRSRDQALVDRAFELAEKNLLASRRMKRPETKAKYLQVARASLQEALDQCSNEELHALLRKAITVIPPDPGAS